MGKWADYLISCVVYKDNHIEKAGVHKDEGESIGRREIKSRSWIIDMIKKGYSFCTIVKNSQGQWIKGAPVGIITVDGEEYLRTDANRTKRDNLGELPEC